MLGCDDECECETLAIGIPGPPGLPGASGDAGCCTLEMTAAHDLSGHRLVVPTDVGTVEYADSTDPTHLNRPIWMTTGATLSGQVATLTAQGLIDAPGIWAWTLGVPVLVGTNGFPVQTLPLGAVFLRRIGEPSAPDELDYRPNQPVAL